VLDERGQPVVGTMPELCGGMPDWGAAAQGGRSQAGWRAPHPLRGCLSSGDGRPPLPPRDSAR
jgi:hypothetical protein